MMTNPFSMPEHQAPAQPQQTPPPPPAPAPAAPPAFTQPTPPSAPPAAPPQQYQQPQPPPPGYQQAPLPGGYGPEEDPFDAPAPQMGKRPRLREMYSRLLLIIPKKLEEGIPNRLNKDGAKQDRLTADVVILDGPTIHYGGAPEKQPPVAHTKQAQVPHKVPSMYISAVGLISQCREALAKKVTTGRPGMVLGRLWVGEAQGDQNPPYILHPPSDADKAIARQYLAAVDPFA